MNARTIATCGFALACSASFQAVQAQTSVGALTQPSEAGLNIYYETDPAGFKVTAQVAGAEGSAFALVAGLGDPAQDPFGLKVVAYGLLDASGSGLAVTFVNEQIVAAAAKGIFLRAAYIDGPTIAYTPPADTILGTTTFCELLDFDHQPGDDSGMVAGLTIDASLRTLARHTNPRAQCTHLFDAACLAVAFVAAGGQDEPCRDTCRRPQGDASDSATHPAVIIHLDWDIPRISVP